jgi:hypothetical protein
MKLDKIIKLGALINIIILSIVLVLMLTTQSCYLIGRASYKTYSGCPVNTPRYFFKQHGTKMTKQYKNNSYSRNSKSLKRYQHRIR